MKKRSFLKFLSIFLSGMSLQLFGFQNLTYAESHKKKKKMVAVFIKEYQHWV